MSRKIRDGAKEWLKLLMPLVVIGIIGLVAAGRIDARMAGAEQRIDAHEAELRIYRKTNRDLLRKVSIIQGYLRAMSERSTVDKGDL